MIPEAAIKGEFNRARDSPHPHVEPQPSVPENFTTSLALACLIADTISDSMLSLAEQRTQKYTELKSLRSSTSSFSILGGHRFHIGTNAYGIEIRERPLKSRSNAPKLPAFQRQGGDFSHSLIEFLAGLDRERQTDVGLHCRGVEKGLSRVNLEVASWTFLMRGSSGLYCAKSVSPRNQQMTFILPGLQRITY